MRSSRAAFLLSLALLLSTPAGPAYPAEPGPAVAAAASLRDLLPRLAERFAERGGTRPRLSFGASGNLRRQIAQGAPFELFLSADERYVLDLAREGHLEEAGSVYALGRLALLVPRGSPLRLNANLDDLGAASQDGRLARLAIANPEHAPYGAAARDALQTAGLWESLRPRLVIGENVAQAAQFVTTGNAQAGIVALAVAGSPRLAGCCEHSAIAPGLHHPIRQRGALVKGAGEGARRFFQFMLGPEGRALMLRGGFDAPDTGG